MKHEIQQFVSAMFTYSCILPFFTVSKQTLWVVFDDVNKFSWRVCGPNWHVFWSLHIYINLDVWIQKIHFVDVSFKNKRTKFRPKVFFFYTTLYWVDEVLDLASSASSKHVSDPDQWIDLQCMYKCK